MTRRFKWTLLCGMIVLLAPAPVKSSSDRAPGENARSKGEAAFVPALTWPAEVTRHCELVWKTDDEPGPVASVPESADRYERGYVYPNIPLMNLLGISVLLLAWQARGQRRRPAPQRTKS